MISARSGRSDITDVLVEGEHIDLDIQENVRICTCTCMYTCTCSMTFYTFTYMYIVSGIILTYSRRQNNVSIHRTVERKEFKRSTDRTTVKERYD